MAQVIGKSRSHVANTLRLLKLPREVRELVSSGQLTAGHARALITVEDPLAMAREIVAGKLSVREAEQLSQRKPAPRSAAGTGPAPRDADIVALEKQLSDATGFAVQIHNKPKSESGHVEIRYRTLEQLDAILARLG